MTHTPNPVPNRILWNERGVCIDEVVLRGVAVVHIEQMDGRCWWIGITLRDGSHFDGEFRADSRGRMRFAETDSDIDWDIDQTHHDVR